MQDKLSNKAQLPRTNAGKYSWLTGLLKCAKCGYALKVSCVKIEQRCKLICSGRSNFGNCDAAIDVDLRELEDYNAHELQNMIVGSVRCVYETAAEHDRRLSRRASGY